MDTDSENEVLGPIQNAARLFRNMKAKSSGSPVKNPRKSKEAEDGEPVKNRRTLKACPICLVKTKQSLRHLNRQHPNINPEDRWECCIQHA